MVFSIIIVNYNTKEILRNCLNSIFKYFSGPFEVIIVDNHSTDGSVVMLKNEFAGKIKLLSSNENKGFGAANNMGAKIADGEYLFFLNSDIIITENILPAIANFFNSDSEIGILAPGLALEDGTPQKFAFGDFSTPYNSISGKFKKEKKTDSVFETDWASGAALAIKKDIFKKLEGFDEKFFMYFEDMDLCKRVKKIGYKVKVLPKLKVVHLGGKSIAANNKRKKMYYASQDYFYKKHYGMAALIMLKIFRWPLKIINSL